MSRWNLIRLELDRTPEFPSGSASRAYMLCAPLDADGMIDAAALARHPGLATVRRFWPNEPDRSGYLVRSEDGWAVAFLSEAGNEEFVHLSAGPLRIGECLSLCKPDGKVFPFRVVDAKPDGIAD